jgi:ribonucleoside-diphosphate reductase alpha chain
MKLSGVSEKVFLDRYALKNKDGEALESTPDEMWDRIAKYVASNEKTPAQKKKWEKEFRWALDEFKYVPGGRILSGAGTGFGVSFYNCFVIPSPKDSRGGIIDSLKNMIEIMSRGGGVGVNFSSLRPRGARVEKVNGFSSGPINWAGLFSLATRDIIQQGGSRRGALMLMLWDWHPDIEEFITVKQDLTKILGANLSVCLSDSFMDAVKADADWPLIFPDVTDPEYDDKWNGDIEVWKGLGKKVIVRKVVKAQYLWNLICEAAHRSAEPGMVFMERVNKLNNNWYWSRINCTNPCGEMPLPDWGVCNLGSINLSRLVASTSIDKPGVFDYETLKKVTRIAVRLQDNVIDQDPYIFQGIRETQLEGERRIGLGTMGIGDALIKLHIRYGSPEALAFIEKVYASIRDEAYAESVELAKEKGSFGKFDKKLYPQGEFIKRLPKEIQSDIKKFGIRNSLLTMQAPTGSTSLMSGASSGIEPIFEFEYTRRDRIGEHTIRHHLWDEYYSLHKEELDSGKLKRPDYFVSANDLTPEDHVKVQAAIQYYVDEAISKTVNAPNAHTIDDVKSLYMMAYELGLKGIAYFREGCREAVLERKDAVREYEKKPEEAKQQLITVDESPVAERPTSLHGNTYRMETPVGRAYITVNNSENNLPQEVFITVGKAGSDVQALAEGLGRAISMILRLTANLPVKERLGKLVEELQDIGGSGAVGFGKNRVRSLPDAVAKVLTMHLLQAKVEKATMIEAPVAASPNVSEVAYAHQASNIETSSTKNKDLCPECKQYSLLREEGCKKCYECGYSAC